MAHASPAAMAIASQTTSVNIPNPRDAADISGTAHFEKRASALLTPPNSISPELAAHASDEGAMSPPPINIEQDTDMQDSLDGGHAPAGGMPLSMGALSNLDDAAAITPSMLAKHHLPGIMLGNGPRPIRYVMGELTQTVPGFSRIPPAKARRIVVAALESRDGGGPTGNIMFSKTGWGRWDAHIKGSSRDSGVGSFNEGNLSPPRSERSGYANSHGDSAINIPGPQLHARRYREQYSGGSWTGSSIREEDELNMDMDPIEEAADKMSLDGDSDSSSESNDETDDEDWAAVGADALRKASLPTPNAPIQNYRKVSVPYTGRFSRQPSLPRRDFPSQSASVPLGNNFGSLSTAVQSPAERDAVAALLSLGSM